MRNEMKISQPWNTQIAECDLSNEIGYRRELMVSEVLSDPQISQKKTKTYISEDTYPDTNGVIETIVRPKIIEYIKTLSGRDPNHLSCTAWANLNQNGDSFNPHSHSDPVTSVLYLTSSDADLRLRDPRTALAMQWPIDMQDTLHNFYTVKPKNGLLLIFPGYIEHYILPSKEEFRISIAMDWWFD
jgi:hypothetical protein